MDILTYQLIEQENVVPTNTVNSDGVLIAYQ